MLLRFAAGLLFWRLATSRRGAYTPAGRPVRGAVPPRQLSGSGRAARLREAGALVFRLVSLAVFVAGAFLLVAAGLGPVVLGPRWIGAVLLTLAAALLVAGAFDAVALQRLLRTRRRRQQDNELAKQVYT
jgi:hypothetical protein